MFPMWDKVSCFSLTIICREQPLSINFSFTHQWFWTCKYPNFISSWRRTKIHKDPTQTLNGSHFYLTLNMAKNHFNYGQNPFESNRDNLGPGGFRGILRDNHGQWKGGYLGAISYCTSLEVELKSIRKCLRWLKDLGLSSIVVKMDSKVSIKWLKTEAQFTLSRHWFFIIICYLMFVMVKLSIRKGKGTNV